MQCNIKKIVDFNFIFFVHFTSFVLAMHPFYNYFQTLTCTLSLQYPFLLPLILFFPNTTLSFRDHYYFHFYYNGLDSSIHFSIWMLYTSIYFNFQVFSVFWGVSKKGLQSWWLLTFVALTHASILCLFINKIEYRSEATTSY